MLIIGLSGKFGSGKDFIGKNVLAEYLKKYYPNIIVNFLSFADPLKLYVIKKYSLTQEDVYPPSGYNKTEYIREILQKEGEFYRDISTDYWIQLYDQMIKTFEESGTHVLITCDVRFPNEMEYIRSRNGLICKVYAPNRTYKTTNKELMKHESECGLDHIRDEQYDYIFINNEYLSNVNEAELKYKDFLKRIFL